MLENETKQIMEKVLGIKYCPAYIFKKYVEHDDWHSCKQLYCCITCPIQSCTTPTCFNSIPKHVCSENYGTLMHAIRIYKWYKRKERNRSGYIWYSTLILRCIKKEHL